MVGTTPGATLQISTAFRITSTNTCDADGNRVTKVAGGVTTWYLVAAVNPSGYPQVVEELTGTTPSTLSKVYSYGRDLICQRQQPSGTVSFYGYDSLGSVKFLTDTTGAITDTYTYDAYGSVIANSGTTPNNYLYTGQQWDPDLSKYYLRARYYDPSTGRFWTRDTFEGNSGDPLSLHKYLYCADNPVNRIDPSGHDGELLSLLTTISIGLNMNSAVNHAVHHQYGMMMFDLAGAISGGFGLAGGLGLLENSLPSALRFAGAGVSASGAVISAANALKGISIVIAETDLIVAMSSQNPHIMTDKNYISTAPDGAGPFTPKFEDLLEGTGIKLSDDINIVEVAGHTGPHPGANQYVFDALQRAVQGLARGTAEYKAAIEGSLKELGKECATPGSPLNKLLVDR